jgi:hypothetical protein
MNYAVVCVSPQLPLLFQDLPFVLIEQVVTSVDQQVLPPCEKGEACYPGGCDMCSGVRHRLAQSLSNPHGQFDLFTWNQPDLFS